jgi:hypothetical protein
MREYYSTLVMNPCCLGLCNGKSSCAALVFQLLATGHKYYAKSTSVKVRMTGFEMSFNSACKLHFLLCCQSFYSILWGDMQKPSFVHRFLKCDC